MSCSCLVALQGVSLKKKKKSLDPGLMVHLSKKSFSKNMLTSHME